MGTTRERKKKNLKKMKKEKLGWSPMGDHPDANTARYDFPFIFSLMNS